MHYFAMLSDMNRLHGMAGLSTSMVLADIDLKGVKQTYQEAGLLYNFKKA